MLEVHFCFHFRFHFSAPIILSCWPGLWLPGTLPTYLLVGRIEVKTSEVNRTEKNKNNSKFVFPRQFLGIKFHHSLTERISFKEMDILFVFVLMAVKA